MKILFVQVPTSNLGSGEIVFPLGLARLTAMTPAHTVKSALDMNLCMDPWSDLRDRLDEFTPDVVALSFRNIDPLAGIQVSYVPSLQAAAQISQLLAPKAKIIVGGPAFSLFANQLMAEIPAIDFGIIGEGEAIFSSLLNSLTNPISVPSLIWRNGSELIKNSPHPGFDLDLLPLPAYDYFNPEDYVKKNKYIAAIGIEGKRGCDLNCGYCLYPRLGGNKMRLRSPQKIVAEIEYLQRVYDINLFHFTDSVVNRPVDHFKAVCRELINRNVNIGWTGFFREDTFTEETAALAKESGLVACYFSGDALTEHGLKLLNKKMSPADILQAARISAQLDILTMHHFLVNLPFETASHHQESMDMMKKILNIHGPAGNLGAVIFNTVRLYPGASLTRKLLKENLLSPETNLLYPVYYNPVETAHVQHELDILCQTAGIFSRLKLTERLLPQ